MNKQPAKHTSARANEVRRGHGRDEDKAERWDESDAGVVTDRQREGKSTGQTETEVHRQTHGDRSIARRSENECLSEIIRMTVFLSDVLAFPP